MTTENKKSVHITSGSEMGRAFVADWVPPDKSEPCHICGETQDWPPHWGLAHKPLGSEEYTRVCVPCFADMANFFIDFYKENRPTEEHD